MCGNQISAKKATHERAAPNPCVITREPQHINERFGPWLLSVVHTGTVGQISVKRARGTPHARLAARPLYPVV